MLRSFFKSASLLCLLLLLWSRLAWPQDITTGLVGYWKMNDGSGTTAADSSGLNHPGTLKPSGGEPTFSPGQVGGSLLLNVTNQHVEVPHHTDFNITGALTLAAWIKRSAISNDTIVCKCGGGAFNWELYVNGGTNQLVFWADTVGTGAGNSTGTVDTNWRHVAVVRSGTVVTYYIDGGASGTGSVTSGNLNAGTIPVLLGLEPPAATWLQGNLDEVRIYNRALNASEINALFTFTDPAPAGAGKNRIISQAR